MEYELNSTIFGLKMLLKSGLEKILWNPTIHKAFFRKSFLLYRKVDFLLKAMNSVTKMTFFAYGGISKNNFVVDVDVINETLNQYLISTW